MFQVYTQVCRFLVSCLQGDEDYLEGGTQLSITVSVDAAQASELSTAVADATAGAVVVEQL
jgi:hypothetical protein